MSAIEDQWLWGARMLGGAAFALARMSPRRYERLADAGAATGILDPLLVRAYLRSGMALPAHERGDGTTHSGASLHLFAAVFADPVQLSLFSPPLAAMRTVLTTTVTASAWSTNDPADADEEAD